MSEVTINRKAEVSSDQTTSDNRQLSAKQIIKKLLEIAIYISVIYFIYRGLRGNFDKIPSPSDIKWHWLVLSLVVFSGHTIFNGFVWYYMMDRSGEKVDKLTQMEVYLKSYALRYIPGNVVGILSRATYNKPHGVSMLKSLWGWFLENSIYLFLGCVIGLYVLAQYSQIAWLNIAVIVAAILGGIVIIFGLDYIEKAFVKLISLKFADRVKESKAVLKIDLYHRLMIMLLYFIAWVIYSISFILTVMSVVDVHPSQYLMLATINAAAWSLGYLAVIVPTGGGVREVVMNTLLIKFLGYNPGIAIAIVALARTVFVVAELLSYLYFYIFKFIYIRWQKN